MRFSVVIPLYNKASYVSKAIGSVLEQTFKDYELIVVDDGSKDDSGNIALQCLGGRENCRFIHQENAGVSMARNKGVTLSHGEYVCFLDADDWWEPTFLEKMDALVSEFPEAGIFGSNYIIVNETKQKTRVAHIGVDQGFVKGYINYCQIYARTLYMPLTSSSVVIPVKVFAETGGFPQGIKQGEDFLLWMRIALKHKVAFLNFPLAYYNQDVDPANRGVVANCYSPDSFMTFHFNQFEEEERENKDLKILLDRIRVFSLLRFRNENLYPLRVREEIAKVDFSNVDKKYWFYYKMPYVMVWTENKIRLFFSRLKQRMR